MSPTAFKQQLSLVVVELEKCDDLCQLIRSNRRLGSTSQALDEFQHNLLHSATKIDSKFKSYRSIIGSRMDLGDDVARFDLQQCIRVLQLTIQQRLSEIAYGHRENRRDPETPGFRRLLERWTKIHYDITSIIESLASRLENKPSTGSPRADANGKPLRPDERIINAKQLDELVEHMKNCWIEKEVRGETIFVNAFDQKKIVYEKPTGFIKAARHVRYEEPDSRWRDTRGW